MESVHDSAAVAAAASYEWIQELDDVLVVLMYENDFQSNMLLIVVVAEKKVRWRIDGRRHGTEVDVLVAEDDT